MRSKRLYIECPYCPERFMAWRDGQSHLKYTHPLDEANLTEVYWEDGGEKEGPEALSNQSNNGGSTSPDAKSELGRDGE